MRIVFAGTPEIAVPSLSALQADGHDIVGVITRAPAPVGRKRVLTPSPVAEFAAAQGLPLYETNRLDEAATDWVAGLSPDLGVIVAYGGLVREPLLSLPRFGWVNVHFSDLPRWRGAAPVQRALMAGEQDLGVTVFRLVAALDAGDVLARSTHPFAPGTSAGLALRELAAAATPTLAEALRVLEADPAAGTPQAGEATYAHKLERADGKLDVTQTFAEVLAHWAGVTPEPGAWATHEEQPIKLLELRPVDLSAVAAGAAPGDLVAGKVTLVEGEAILHLTDGALEIVTVQPAGKAAMPGAAWLRGRGGEAVLA